MMSGCWVDFCVESVRVRFLPREGWYFPGGWSITDCNERVPLLPEMIRRRCGRLVVVDGCEWMD